MVSQEQRNITIVNVFPIIFYHDNKNAKNDTFNLWIKNLWTKLHLSMLSNQYEEPTEYPIRFEKLSTYFINVTTILNDNCYEDFMKNDYFIFENLQYKEADYSMNEVYKFPCGAQIVENTKHNITTFISTVNNTREVHIVFNPTITKLPLALFDNLENQCSQYLNNYKPINNYPLFGKLYSLI